MSKMHRRVLQLAEQGMSTRQIAAEVGKAEPTIRVRLSEARRLAKPAPELAEWSGDYDLEDLKANMAWDRLRDPGYEANRRSRRCCITSFESVA